VLSRLYGTEIKVVRADGQIFVLSRGHNVEHADHLHDEARAGGAQDDHRQHHHHHDHA
jgi:hypothetical protein